MKHEILYKQHRIRYLRFSNVSDRLFGFFRNIPMSTEDCEDFRHGFEVVSTTGYFNFILFLFRMFFFLFLSYLFIYLPSAFAVHARPPHPHFTESSLPFLAEITIKPWHSNAKITKGRIGYVVVVTLYERSAGYYFILKLIILIPSPNTAVSKEVQHCRSE